MKKTPKNLDEALSQLVGEGHSVQSPSDQTTGWSVAESSNSPKDVTNHIIKDIKGDFWVDVLDPDTEEIIVKPGDLVAWEDEGTRHSGTITKELSPTEDYVFKVDVQGMDLDETTNEHHMHSREDKINFILKNQIKSTSATSYEPWNIDMLGYLTDVDIDKVYDSVEKAGLVKEIETKPQEDCPYCSGTGEDDYSNCCGSRMSGLAKDLGICPDCKEHTDTECQMCNGTGKVDADEVENKLQEADNKKLEIILYAVLEKLKLFIPSHLFQVSQLNGTGNGLKIEIAHNVSSDDLLLATDAVNNYLRYVGGKATWSPFGYSAIVELDKQPNSEIEPTGMPAKGEPAPKDLALPNAGIETDLDEVFGKILQTMGSQGERPSDDAPKPVEPVKEDLSAQEIGLIVVGSSQIDNAAIGKFVEQGPFYAEWNAREHYWFFPEAEETIDALEMELDKEFAARGINARFEGQVDEAKETTNLIKEYLVREGSLIDDVLGLNLFEDMTNEDYTFADRIAEWKSQGFDTSPAEAVYSKYRPIAQEFENRINLMGDRALTHGEAELLDQTWYDGSDAYDTPESFADYMPNFYDSQIAALKPVMDYSILDEKLDPVGQEDGDINNDGKYNSIDAYLLNRRADINKNIDEGNNSVDVAGLLTKAINLKGENSFDNGWNISGDDETATFEKKISNIIELKLRIVTYGRKRWTSPSSDDQLEISGTDYKFRDVFADLDKQTKNELISLINGSAFDNDEGPGADPYSYYGVSKRDLGFAESEKTAKKFATVEKTVKGMTYVVGYPSETGNETKDGLYAWETKDNANRVVHFAKDKEEAQKNLKTL